MIQSIEINSIGTQFKLWLILIASFVLASNVTLVNGAKPGQVIETIYASSLFRANQMLENVAQLAIIENVDRVFHCLGHCQAQKTACRAFNYGRRNGTCILLAESLCSNETYELSPSDEFNYYDLLNNADQETKHLKDQYCQVYGKCSSGCYPRRPQFVDKAMTYHDAYDYCRKLGRKLPQPRSQAENAFYGDFGRKLFLAQSMELGGADSITSKQLSNIKGTLERQLKDVKYWIGITDEDMEGFWLFTDDETLVSESFSAWAVSQPDNGGAFGSKQEHCAVIELRDYNWLDVSCQTEMNFFCA